MPSVTATPEQLLAIVNGRQVRLPDLSDARLVKVFAGQDLLVAICERIAGPLFRPKTVLYDARELKQLLATPQPARSQARPAPSQASSSPEQKGEPEQKA